MREREIRGTFRDPTAQEALRNTDGLGRESNYLQEFVARYELRKKLRKKGRRGNPQSGWQNALTKR